MKYFVMACEGPYPAHTIRIEPNLPGGPWYHGQKLRIAVPARLEYQLNPDYEEYDDDDDDEGEDYNMKMMYSAEAIPLMHNSLIKVLLSAGVNNLELFPARITNPNTNEVYDDYHAFNVIGLVAAADLNASTLMHPNSKPRILDTDFESLVIDEEKTNGFHLFRLAEACSAICVSEQVKNAIEENTIPGMIFYGPGEWSG
jgi:hypothetical protein